MLAAVQQAVASPGEVVRPRRRIDPVAVLSAYLFLLVMVPATLVVGPLGAAGSPASLFATGCLLWWVLARMDRRLGLVRGRQPMRLLAAGFFVAMSASYLAGAMRVAQAVELRAADRAVLRMLAGIGVLLLAADGVRTRDDLDRLLRSLTIAGGVLAGFGLVQFLFGLEITTYIRIPGLEDLAPPQLIQQRSVFRRVPGTTSHPIEFGVTLAMLLPIALHCATTAHRRRGLLWACAGAIGAAIPASISRSAVLGLGLSWLVLMVGWDTRRRLNALIATPFALAALRLAVPGLLGTIKSLFTGISNDPSYLGRTEDYEYVRRFIAERPWFGRGFGTFIPDLYTTLDNQYLGQIVETGYVGLVALLALLGSGVVIGWMVKRRATSDDAERSLGVSLAAASIVPLATYVTFDGLSFPVVTGMSYLVLGCTGAAWRVRLRPARQFAPAPPPAANPALADA